MECIHQCLLQKEAYLLPGQASAWIQHEAIEQKYLPDYGTFREALIRCFEDRVTPVLTAVLKEMDRNGNLAILQMSPHYNNLWLDLFEHCVSASNVEGRKLPESNIIEVSRFPFSSHVIQQLEDVAKAHGSQGI